MKYRWRLLTISLLPLCLVVVVVVIVVVVVVVVVVTDGYWRRVT
jgi:hypothetical protein